MSIFNSKDKNTCGRPCQCETSSRTTDIPQTPYGEEAPKADTRDGRLTKITIESPDGSVQVIEAHGVAMTTLRDIGDKYEGAVGVFGVMSVKEQMELWMSAKHKLVPELEEIAVRNAADKYSVKELMGVLKDILGDM